MRILVISDTHIPASAKALPKVIEEEAKKSDACLHAGDIVDYKIIENLSKLTKTYAVCGNMDDKEVASHLEIKKILKFDLVTVGLTHGRGAPANLIEYIDSIFTPEEKKDIDIFVFGHSHVPTDKEINNKIYFNPGSPTDIFFAPYKSYGILEINGKEIKRTIIKINE